METKDYITVAISAVALCVSLVSATVAIRRQKMQMRTAVRDQLSSIVQELITTLAENQVHNAEDMANRDALFYSKMSSFTLKLSSLARQAAALASQDREVVFDVEFSVIAQAFAVVGDASEADRYWQAAVVASPSDYYRIVNKRGHADFLFRQGLHQAGRKQYEDALTVWPNDSDFNKWTNGYTYQMWFNSEYWNIPAPHGRAEECYREAMGVFESISAPVAKTNALRSLAAARAAAEAGASPRSPLPPSG